MPILDLEIVTSDSTESLPPNLTQSLADAVAQVFGAPQGTVWVKSRDISASHYAENGGVSEGVYPVFVTVLKSKAPEGSALKDEIAWLTEAIANILDRPKENIHIFYRPDAAGRIAFGGKLVE